MSIADQYQQPSNRSRVEPSPAALAARDEAFASMAAARARKRGEAPPVEPERKPQVMEVALSAIKPDQQAQPREHLNNETIGEYADAMQRGDKFPPLVVFADNEHHWLADGFHRFYAAQSAKVSMIRCEVHIGTLRDAILFSVGANAKNGLHRATADKQRAIQRLLDDPEWSKLSDREIARHCAVSHTTVASQRERASGQFGQIASTDSEQQTERQVTRGGKTYTQRTAGINAGRKKSAPASPDAENKPLQSQTSSVQVNTSSASPDPTPAAPNSYAAAKGGDVPAALAYDHAAYLSLLDQVAAVPPATVIEGCPPSERAAFTSRLSPLVIAFHTIIEGVSP